MQNGEEEIQGTTETAPTPAPEEVTKQSFRVKVWRHLETNGLAVFPRPVFSRIPNFKGSQEAADKLAELDVFKNATHINVHPDKPQEPVRMYCLEQKKTLYVPVPRLNQGFINRIDLPETEIGPHTLRKAVSRSGMEEYGKPLGLEDTVALDLVVMGSVAVSKQGHRIGKGRGYGDLEFGLLMQMKAIKPSTLVVTTVHDCQVFDTLPAELFGAHDTPIDIIITPTQVIETKHSIQRPSGVLWHLLSNRRVQLMPILGLMRESEMLAGRPCVLREVDTDIEERPAGPRLRRQRRHTRSARNASTNEGNNSQQENAEPDSKDGKPRQRQRRRTKSTNKENKEDKPATTPNKHRKPKKPKPEIEFSVKISNISPHSRVRDLKQALSERGVKPQIMVWKGMKGYCYLHFFKTGPLKGEGDSELPPLPDIDGVLTALAHMSLSVEEEPKPRELNVEPAPPPPPKPLQQPAETAKVAADVTAQVATEITA